MRAAPGYAARMVLELGWPPHPRAERRPIRKHRSGRKIGEIVPVRCKKHGSAAGASVAKQGAFRATARQHHLQATTILAVSFGDTERT
jgi:hypothetical protein